MLDWLIEQGTKYAPLIKTGATVGMGVASYLDQKRKNEMQQAAYDDYMAQVEAAGQEARAAIELGRTGALPMVMTGVPQTKADVTDFTAVAARGGLMSIPNRQRKRYARGPDEVDVMEFDEESITPFDLQQETGLDLTGEQVKYDTGNSREDAWSVWNSGGIDQEIYEFDFEIFFDSGDWMDHLRGEVPMQGLQGNTMMASADPMLQDEYDKYVFELQEIQPDATPMSIEDFRNQAVAGQANGGIIGLRHGGRPGYRLGDEVVEDRETIAQSITLPDGGEEVVTDSMEEIKGHMAGPDWYIQRVQHLEFLFGDELTEDEIADIAYDSDKYYDKVGHDPFAKGGRAGYAQGSGIMNLGGLEKDYRTTGGFVPIGAYEKKDDVPARLSKNEFVMTADAVRAAGGGSINKGAQLMYDTMKNLEAQPQAQRMIA